MIKRYLKKLMIKIFNENFEDIELVPREKLLHRKRKELDKKLDLINENFDVIEFENILIKEIPYFSYYKCYIHENCLRVIMTNIQEDFKINLEYCLECLQTKEDRDTLIKSLKLKAMTDMINYYQKKSAI